MEETRPEEDRRQCGNRSTYLPWLGELHKRAGMSQRDLAETAGVSRGTVYSLENGLRGAYPRTQRKLAAALGGRPEALTPGRRPPSMG